MLSDLFIVTASIRKGFSYIMQKLPLFVACHLTTGLLPRDPEHVRRYWQAAGLHVDLLADVIEADPMRDDHQLNVPPNVYDKPDAIHHVTNLLNGICNIRTFSDNSMADCRGGVQGVVKGALRRPPPSQADGLRGPDDVQPMDSCVLHG